MTYFQHSYAQTVPVSSSGVLSAAEAHAVLTDYLQNSYGPNTIAKRFAAGHFAAVESMDCHGYDQVRPVLTLFLELGESELPARFDAALLHGATCSSCSLQRYTFGAGRMILELLASEIRRHPEFLEELLLLVREKQAGSGLAASPEVSRPSLVEELVEYITHGGAEPDWLGHVEACVEAIRIFRTECESPNPHQSLRLQHIGAPAGRRRWQHHL